jgi:proline iminopeptidase
MQPTPSPFNTTHLSVSPRHQIFLSEYGNPQGPTILSLHGGPGSKSKPHHVANFDLHKYHLVTFDQRGCGLSTPSGELQDNTTQDLIADIRLLKEHLQLRQFILTGSSWGSTLALLYAQAHPQDIQALLLSSIFLARPQDFAWGFDNPHGVSKFFPDLWQHQLQFFKRYSVSPPDATRQLLAILQNTTDQECISDIIAHYSSWERNLMNAFADTTLTAASDVTAALIASTKIFMHYESHYAFLPANQILDHAPTLRHIPTLIVHGRYDLLCTPDQAWLLHQALPGSELIFLPTSNHALTAEGMIARAQAYDNFLRQHLEKS